MNKQIFNGIRAGLAGSVIALSQISGLAQWVHSDASKISWVLCSADGGALFMVEDSAWTPELLYASTNWGATWSSNGYVPSTQMIVGAACSANGRSMALLDFFPGDFGASQGSIHTSTDSGVSWLSQRLPPPAAGWEYWWSGLACSADGNVLAAVASANSSAFGDPPALFISHDFGITWSITNTAVPWTSVAVSGDGSRLVATSAAEILMSTNGGWTWSTLAAPSHSWQCVAASADGRAIVAGAYDGWICDSTNYGQTWVSNTLPGAIYGVTSCAEGRTLLASVLHGRVNISTNYGATWTDAGAPQTNVVSVAMTADGNKLAVADYWDLYTLQRTPKPLLSIGRSSGNLLLSWTLPSMPFVAQQNSSVSEATWVDVTAGPELNCADLKNEVFLQPGTGPRFYRLTSR